MAASAPTSSSAESAHTPRSCRKLAAVARTAIAQTGATPDTLTAGISGLTDQDADAAALLSLLAGTGIRSAVLAHDSTTSYLGALGDTRGAVVASGTGVVTLAVGVETVVRVDGWGYIMGDAGSGYWIGRAALDAAMRDVDGRGARTALTDVLRQRWPDPTRAYIDLQADEERVSIVATFAADVARLSEAGDVVAAAITRAAAAELVLSVTTALRRVAHPDDDRFSVCAMGGVFRSAPLQEAFTDTLPADLGGIPLDLVPPRGEGIDGAIALAGLPAGHALASAVHAARLA